MVAEAATKAQDFLLPSPFTRTCLHKILQWWYTWTHTNKIVLFSPSTLLSLSLTKFTYLVQFIFCPGFVFLVCPFARAHTPLSKTLHMRQVIQSSKVNCRRRATTRARLHGAHTLVHRNLNAGTRFWLHWLIWVAIQSLQILRRNGYWRLRTLLVFVPVVLCKSIGVPN